MKIKSGERGPMERAPPPPSIAAFRCRHPPPPSAAAIRRRRHQPLPRFILLTVLLHSTLAGEMLIQPPRLVFSFGGQHVKRDAATNGSAQQVP